MSLFPDYPNASLAPYVWRPRFKTFLAGPFNNENLVTRAGIQFPLHGASISFYQPTWANLAKLIYEFFVASKGRYGSFAFYDIQGWDASPNVGILWGSGTSTAGNAPLYVATQTTGGVTTFDVPAYHARVDGTRRMYVNGSNVTWNTWTRDTGADGRDRVVLAAAPSLGDVVTCSFFGRRVWKASFAQDSFDVNYADLDTYTFTVELVEVP